MDFFVQAVNVLQILVMAVGAGLGAWGVINRRDMEMIIQEQMLMYGKEASNRKQEIDRQHYTIPNQRPKDKHCGKI